MWRKKAKFFQSRIFSRNEKDEKYIEGSGVWNTKNKPIYVFLSPDPKMVIKKHHVSLDEKLASKNHTESETSAILNELLWKEVVYEDEFMSMAGVMVPKLLS